MTSNGVFDPKRDDNQFNVLLVEDDHVFRGLIAKNLRRRGLNVREAENGLVAKTILELAENEFHVVISDVRMPEMDGVALLKHVRSTSKVPFIVMTGFSELIEARNAFELGATEFLPKPVKTDALLEAISRCLAPASTRDEAPRQTDTLRVDEFCQIHVDEFISTTSLRSDIYLKLGEKFVKVAHKGDSVPIDRLKKYQASSVDYLYVRVEEFRNYVNLNIQVSNVVSQSNVIAKEAKLRVLKHTAEIITETCFRDGFDKAIFDSASRVVLDTVRLVGDDRDILSVLANMHSGANRLYVHSVAVSVFSTMIAKAVGWASMTTQFKASVCGLFHDIGKRELDPEILDKKRILLSLEEVKALESHVVRGRNILRQLPSLPEDVGDVAYQHHENFNGTGYPHAIKGEQIHPMARVVRVADLFVGMLFPLNEEDRLDPAAAVKKIEKIYEGEIDPQFLRGLAKALNVPLEVPRDFGKRLG